jgi:PRTRC genetic system protein C
MALTVSTMSRCFHFLGVRLPDPNPAMSVDEVKAFYTAQYPELATAVVNGPEAVGISYGTRLTGPWAAKGNPMSRRVTDEEVLRELEALARGHHQQQQTPLMRFARCSDWQKAAEAILNSLQHYRHRRSVARLSPPSGWLPPLT